MPTWVGFPYVNVSTSCTPAGATYILWNQPSGATTVPTPYWYHAVHWYHQQIEQYYRNQQQAAAMRMNAQNAAYQAARQQERIVQRRTRDMARHADDVQQRARELLLQHLTPGQRESFLTNKFFVVEGGRSKRRYRIEDLGHLVANIRVIEERGGRLCGHIRAPGIPMGDHLLAQKLMLEGSEEEFLRLANRHP